MTTNTEQTQVQEQLAKYVAALVQGTHEITSVTIRPKPAQQPMVGQVYSPFQQPAPVAKPHEQQEPNK